MIIDRYLIKEIALTFIGVTVVLVLILLSALMIKLFAEAASGKLQLDTIFLLMGLKSIGNLVFILPLSMYLSILLALSRLHKDSEMAALAACGIGQFRVLRSVMILAVFYAIAIASLTLYIAPWAEQEFERIAALSHSESEVKGINPGRFLDFSRGAGTVYIERINNEKTELKNIFVQGQQDDQQVVITAESGTKISDKKTGDDFIELRNGYRYQGNSGEKNYSIVHFEKHGIRILQKPPKDINYHRRAKKSETLYASPVLVDNIELHWRISSIFLSLVLAVLAVPLSRTSPRQGQYAKLTIAILIYISYANILNVTRAWLMKGKIPLELSFWWLHLLMLIIAFAIMFNQSGYRYIFRRLH